MALLFASASSQYLKQSAALITGYPASFACWYKPTTTTANTTAISVGVNNTTSITYFDLGANAGGAAVAAIGEQGIGSKNVPSVATMSNGTWYHIAAVWSSATVFSLWLNGVQAVGATTSITPTSLDTTLIAALTHGTGTGPESFADAAIAYPTIWNIALTSGDVAALYNSGTGADPRNTEASNLKSFSLLTGSAPFPDAITSTNWTVIGSPTVVADPFSIGSPPTVTVQAASSITSTGASLNGNITNLNGAGNATSYGFNYGLTSSYGSSVASSAGSYGTGAFTLNASNLAPGITYHCQAFAVGPGGEGFSTDTTFTTSSASPTNKGEVLFDGPNQLSSGTTSSGSVANLFDGNNQTIWFTSSTGAWAGIDCGAATTLTRLRYTATPIYEDATLGATINGDLSDSTFASPALLSTLSATVRPSTGTLLNEVDVSPGASYQYYMVQVASGNIWGFADLDFIGTWASGVYSQPVAPVITPPGGNYDQPTVVRMSCITTSATIYYTLDGTTPTSSSTQYTGPFTVTTSKQVNAIAIDTELSTPSSRVTTAYFIIPSALVSQVNVYDNRGYRLTSTRGQIFLDPVSKYYYQYLLDQDYFVKPSTGNAMGTNVYRSADLRNWTYTGNICGPAIGSQINSSLIAGRIQMFYNAANNNYVAWTEGNDTDSLRVWTSTAPDGSVPFTIVGTFNAGNILGDGNTGGQYGDMGSFVDPVSGNAYIIYNYAANTNTAFSKLNSSYTNTVASGSATYSLIGEAHTVFYYSGTYFYMYSGLTGLTWNLNHYQTSTTPIGPWSGATVPFQTVTNSPPVSNSYDSQCDWIMPIPGRGSNAYMFWADNLNNDAGPPNIPYPNVRLCLPVVFPTSSSMTISWQNSNQWFDGTYDSSWSLDTVFPTVSGAPVAASNFIISNFNATWTNNSTVANIYLDNCSSTSFTSGVISEVIAPGATSFSINTAVQTGKYFRIRTVNVNGTSSTGATTNNPIVLVGITKHANKYLKLGNMSSALATQLFPLATLQSAGFLTFQQWAQYIGWDTPADVAIAYFAALP